MNNKKFGVILIVVAIIFGIGETIYFGNNILPASNNEIVCDIIAILLFIWGTILLKRK